MAKTFKQNYSKYRNKRLVIDGFKFDSQKEANYFLYLKSEHDAGRLKNVTMQPEFVLQNSFKDRNGKTHRKIKYIADFLIEYPDGRKEIIDVKGFKTEIYKLKKKLFLFKNPNLVFIEIL